MRRYVPLLIAGAALLAAACRDAISPGGSASQTRSMAVMPTGTNVSSSRANPKAEQKATTFTFRLDVNGGSLRIGAFRLDYPANVVCDPNRSGYGPDEWKKPCESLGRDISMRARFWTDGGVAYADFNPDIRFDPSKVVTLTTVISDIRGLPLTPELRSTYAVGYTTSNGTTRFFVDEGADDPSLATVFGLNADGTATGWARRRIYHFSGYYVRSGRYCDEFSIDPECSGGSGLY